MRTGILGSSNVGASFARAFPSRGHEVMIGSREPDKLNDFAREHNGLLDGTNGATAQFAELIVIGTRFTGTKNALELAGPQNFAGKAAIEQCRLRGPTIRRWTPDNVHCRKRCRSRLPARRE